MAKNPSSEHIKDMVGSAMWYLRRDKDAAEVKEILMADTRWGDLPERDYDEAVKLALLNTALTDLCNARIGEVEIKEGRCVPCNPNRSGSITLAELLSLLASLSGSE